MSLKHLLVAGFASVLLAAGAWADTESWALVTAEEIQAEAEFAAERSLQAGQQRRSHPGAPAIKILAPDVDTRLASPITMHVTFSAQEGSDINPASLRILYGLLRLDVTERVLQHVSFDGTQLRADGMELPNGTHRFTVEIADTKERLTRSSIKVRVRTVSD